MCGYWSLIIGSLLSASVILPEPLWGIDRGWQSHRLCREFVKDRGLCRKLAEDTFRAQFPALSIEWPTCGKDDLAEAILWAAIADRGFVDRYVRQFRSLCATGR